MKQKKTEIKDWQIKVVIAGTVFLVLWSGIFIGRGEWLYAICNAMWAFISYTVVRNMRNAKRLIEEIEKDDEKPSIVPPIFAYLLADAMKKAKEKDEEGTENKPSCSAENNDSIEFAHNAEGDGNA